MLSVICCFYDELQFQTNVISSLEKQKSSYQLLPIDNTEGKYTSIAKAYNDLWKNVDSEVFVFMHPDIAFEDENFIEKLEKYLMNNKDELLGFAGKCSNGLSVSNLKYRVSGEYIVENQISNFTQVETLDECCFACHRELLEQLGGFNESLCDGWHLYLAELCIRCKKRGCSIYAVPWSIYHKDKPGGLSVDFSFLRTFVAMWKEYRKEYSMIYSSCFDCPSDFFLGWINIITMYIIVFYRYIKKSYYNLFCKNKKEIV